MSEEIHNCSECEHRDLSSVKYPCVWCTQINELNDYWTLKKEGE